MWLTQQTLQSKRAPLQLLCQHASSLRKSWNSMLQHRSVTDSTLAERGNDLQASSHHEDMQAMDMYAVEVKLLKQQKRLQVKFSDGATFSYPAELLRVLSPSADSLRDKGGRTKVVSGRRHVGIMGLETVGSYAVRLQFDDLHASGIYSWPFLHDLGARQRTYIRTYLAALKEKGLSRDPLSSRKKVGTGHGSHDHSKGGCNSSH